MDRESLAAGLTKTASALREQLSQITAASQMLERAKTADKSHAYLAVINRNICRMLRTIERLELSHRLTDDNEIRIFPNPVDLAELAEELFPKLQSALEPIGVHFTWDVPASLPVCMDKGLVHSMLLELICNAAQAGTHVTLTIARRNDRICFTVSDDGEGVSAQDLPRLFDSDEGSLGQGVPMAQRIAELHGGSLMADSAPGRGLTMAAVLPVGEPRKGIRLESPFLPLPTEGFDEALVAFSELLPAEMFLPEELN